MDDLKGRAANITFAQLLGLCPKLKREWKRWASPRKANEPEPMQGEMELMSVEVLPDICPSVDAWCGGKSVGEAYVDGGA